MTLVIFSIKKIRYSLDVRSVEEVIPLPAITSLSNLPSFFTGIIYLRGNAVPIVDLRKRLGYEDHPYELDNDIIVIKVNGKTAGLIVDKVLSVIDVDELLLMNVQDAIEGVDNKYLSAVAHIENELIILLNVEQILSAPGGDPYMKFNVDAQGV